MGNTKTESTRHRGHPRTGGSTSATPRTDILDAADRLFRQNGYTKTSVTAIAREAGLDQSSLYYWFKSKEHILDEILVSKFETCCFKGKLFHAPAPCAVRLYALLFRRTYKYCMLPVDVYEVESAADASEGHFERFFTNLTSYKFSLHTLVEEGTNTGEFRTFDTWKATTALIGHIMGMQHLYHRRATGKSAFMTAEGEPELGEDAHSYATLAATAGVSLMLADATKLEDARKQAQAHGWLEV